MFTTFSVNCLVFAITALSFLFLALKNRYFKIFFLFLIYIVTVCLFVLINIPFVGLLVLIVNATAIIVLFIFTTTITTDRYVVVAGRKEQYALGVSSRPFLMTKGFILLSIFFFILNKIAYLYAALYQTQLSAYQILQISFFRLKSLNDTLLDLSISLFFENAFSLFLLCLAVNLCLIGSLHSIKRVTYKSGFNTFNLGKVDV